MWSFLSAILVILAAVFLMPIMPMMIFLIIFLFYKNLLEDFDIDEK